MTLAIHNKDMENHYTTGTQQKKKNNHAMKKIGKTIKDTFIEMSSSLAGWIDDTSTQFSAKKTPKNPKSSTLPQAKSGAKFTGSKSN